MALDDGLEPGGVLEAQCGQNDLLLQLGTPADLGRV
jgi:hypothetical protein